MRSLPSDKEDEQICLKLQCLVPEHKEHAKEKPKLKEYIPPKVKPKIKKPKVEKVLKKIIPKPLTVPIIKEEVKPIEEPQELYVEPIKEEVVEVEEFIPVQSAEEKAMAQEQEYMDENIKKIVKLLSENLYYPRSARKRGIVGKVVVKFSLAHDATVSSVEIISSKSEILSRAAIKTIEDLSGDFPKPHEELVLHVPINYELKK